MAWRGGRVRLVDQRALPRRLRFVECGTVSELCDAIRSLVVRGAPALGVTGAFGVALAVRTERGVAAVRRAAARLREARPTAVNLAWGVDRALAAWEAGGSEAALVEAERIAAADVAANRALGAFGAELVPAGARVLTHCNAGALAAAGYGTALGVVRAAFEAGKAPTVWVDETRPVLQGARLTAWELDRLGIEATVIPDALAGSLMAAGRVDVVVVGADRIAANGDVANKVGTYPLAVLAREHDVPFYVAAPTSTIDLATPDAGAVVVEERPPEEVLRVGRERIAPAGARALNLAFDLTPGRLVTAVVTEQGVARRPYGRSLAALVRQAGA
ncbi:MAG: S-methyl-5-thioribose-1-phosphate isomerase [Acidimicrobiia bacterium]|nr:S-methyl-5-thioribose-1-phosphate isomerase [Acidimicrobiia bacterium]